MTFQVCSDIGGTFTDVFIRDELGATRSIKTPTTPEDLTVGLFDALEKAGAAFGVSAEELLAGTNRFIHGTTVATNAIIEHETAKTALITTEGFRDVLTLREGGKENPYDWDVDYPDPYIPRALTWGVPERITPEGSVELELDEDRTREVIREIVDRDVEAVAVSLLWSHQNDTHEQRVGELIAEEAPGVRYSLSSEIAPIIREYRRTSATAINASLYAVVEEYLTRLGSQLQDYGFGGTPFIITANGGLMQIDEIARSPIWMVDAGPTMFPVAAHTITHAETDSQNVIALDMGGTSLDMGVVRNGNISRSRDAKVEGDHILGIEKVEIKSIGSGGGSIAWVDSGGLLHVGPESAGAVPGPACYLRGGENPTVTDAALVLGYLNEEYFLGGEMEVSKAASEAALEDKIESTLGLDATDAAHAVYATANQNIINGVKSVTIERGINPRKYVLSGGGGALGVHAVEIARELQIDRILLPSEAGVVSALGGLTSDVRRDFSESHFTNAADFDYAGVNDALASLRAKAESFFERAELPPDRQGLTWFTEARYPNQVWELEVPLNNGHIPDGAAGDLADAFHRVHDDTYGFNIESQDVEFLQWRVEAMGQTDTHDLTNAPNRRNDLPEDPVSVDARAAHFNGDIHQASVYRADSLPPTASITGPAFVEAETMTIVLPPDSSLTVTEAGNYDITPSTR